MQCMVCVWDTGSATEGRPYNEPQAQIQDFEEFARLDQLNVSKVEVGPYAADGCAVRNNVAGPSDQSQTLRFVAVFLAKIC